ncbi:MAG: hypothetical protein AB7Q00_14660 [Phycisphaerales bacterium]
MDRREFIAGAMGVALTPYMGDIKWAPSADLKWRTIVITEACAAASVDLRALHDALYPMLSGDETVQVIIQISVLGHTTIVVGEWPTDTNLILVVEQSVYRVER